MTISNIEFIFTNDLHSHLEQWPKVMTLFNEKRSTIKHDVFVFDIGDHVDRFHPLSEATLGRANVLLMNDANYDSVTIGNNEGITLPKEELSGLYSNATFPVLVANLFEPSGERPTWVKPYHILQTTSGINIGVIGLTMPYRPFYEELGWVVEDIFEILPPLVNELRRKTDLVILLSHLGLNNDEEIARQIEGIDIILGGHTHHVLEKGLCINNTIIHQAGKFGTYVGQLSITYDHKERKIKDYNAECVPVDNFSACPNTVASIMELSKRKQPEFDQKVCNLSSPLPISWTKPSSFAKILASAVKEWCSADIGMINSGLLLEGLPEGVVTKRDLHRVCPHPINPCKVELTGKVLKEVILHGLSDEMTTKNVKGFGFRGTVMGLLIFDGVTFEEKLLSDGLSHVLNISINGKSIEPNHTYQVATVDMFTFGHLYPAIAAAKVKTYYMPEFLRDLLAWKLSENYELRIMN